MNKFISDVNDNQLHEGLPPLMPLRPVANKCNSNHCPTIYTSGSSSGTLVVQGYTVSPERAGIDVPDGETLVEIPLDLLAEALRNLS